MTRLFPVVCGLLLVTGAASPTEPAKVIPTAFDGKVQPLGEVLKKLGSTPDADTTGVALVTADGAVYTLVKDAASRLLFLDEQLHNRDVRLTATVLPGTRTLQVTKVQTVKGGKVYDVDYWCDQCQLEAKQPGKCICCGGDTVLRELPAK